MGVIDVTAGFPEVCMAKANLKLSALFDGLVELSHKDQFQKLERSFDLFRDCATKCIENFEAEKFDDRENGKKSSDQLQSMIFGAIQGHLLVQGIVQKMQESSLSQVNGTSSIFAQCATNAIVVHETLTRGIDVYNQEMYRRQGLNLAAE